MKCSECSVSSDFKLRFGSCIRCAALSEVAAALGSPNIISCKEKTMKYSDEKERLYEEHITAAKKAAEEWKKIEDQFDPQIGRKTGLFFGGNAEDFE